MVTFRTFRTMLVCGIALIVVGVAGGLLVGAVLSTVDTRSLGIILTLLSSVFSLADLAGCGFVVLSILARALGGRRISPASRRPISAIVLWSGVAAVIVGLASNWVVQSLTDAMTQSQTGRDLLTVIGWTLFPLFGNLVPTIGALAVPASVLLRAVERGPAPLAPQPVFSGSRPRPDESAERPQP